MQLKCTWYSISPKLWYRCRRIVVPGLPASHLPYNTNMNGEYGGWRSSLKPAFWMTASALADLWSDALSCLQLTSVFFPKLKEFMKRHNIFWRRGRYLHGMWLAGRPKTTILLQRDQSFGKMLDQVHFSHRRRSGWTSGGTHGECRSWVRVEWGGIWGGMSPLQPTKGSGGASWAEPRPKTRFWRILKATERSFLYLYDKIWGGGTICISVPRSKFWGGGLVPHDLRPWFQLQVSICWKVTKYDGRIS